MESVLMAYSFENHRITGGIGADDEFWRGLEDGVFKLPRCLGCGITVWPAHFRCGHCGSWNMRWIERDPVGRAFTWTRTWYSFDRVRERASDIPFVTVVAEIAHTDGARVMGVLAGSDEGLHIGAPLRGVILAPSEKTKWYPSIAWEIVASGTTSDPTPAPTS
jgi:uncharacterized protein